MGDTFNEKSTTRIVRAVKKIEGITPPNQRIRKPTPVNTFILAKVVAAGPDSESDYSDSRYWFKKIRLNNSDNDNTTVFSFVEVDEDEPDYLHATAVNLVEAEGGTHTVPMDTIIRVFPIRSANSKRIQRYEFSY